MGELTKTQQAIEKFRAGDLEGALKIARTFHLGLTENERKALSLAYECLLYPTFYKGVGTDIDASIERGKRVFQTKIERSV
jgi:hypothetical protein